MDWKVAEVGDNQTYKIPDRWLSLHYYEAINILFRLENALRVLVYLVLKEQFKEKWTEVAIISDEGESTIQAVAKNEKCKQLHSVIWDIQSRVH